VQPVHDRLDQRRALGGQLAEQGLAGVDVGGGELATVLGDLQLRVFHRGQPQQDGRVDLNLPGPGERPARTP
jgi:hypothetical protein